jgi:hypothetical protein
MGERSGHVIFPGLATSVALHARPRQSSLLNPAPLRSGAVITPDIPIPERRVAADVVYGLPLRMAGSCSWNGRNPESPPYPGDGWAWSHASASRPTSIGVAGRRTGRATGPRARK